MATSPIKKFTCDYCDSCLSSVSSFNKHMKRHLGETPFQCSLCDESFSYETYLERHILTHNKPCKASFLCDICDKVFKSNDDVDKHKKRSHVIRPFLCYICDAAFAYAQGLKRHVCLTHNEGKLHKCDQCNATFLEVHDLECHMKIHDEGCNFYICDFCDKHFTQRSGLLTHRRNHTGYRPYCCSYCDATYTTSSNLKSHVESWHTKRGTDMKKKKEYRVRCILKKYFEIDDQTHFSFKYGCVENPDAYRAFVDFHIVSITSAFVMVECDENQHKTYPVSCGLTRMLQIHENILRMHCIKIM